MLSLSPGSSHRDPQFVPGCSHVFPPCSRFAAISHGHANYFQDDTVSFRISNVKPLAPHQYEYSVHDRLGRNAPRVIANIQQTIETDATRDSITSTRWTRPATEKIGQEPRSRSTEVCANTEISASPVAKLLKDLHCRPVGVGNKPNANEDPTDRRSRDRSGTTGDPAEAESDS